MVNSSELWEGIVCCHPNVKPVPSPENHWILCFSRVFVIAGFNILNWVVSYQMGLVYEKLIVREKESEVGICCAYILNVCNTVCFFLFPYGKRFKSHNNKFRGLGWEDSFNPICDIAPLIVYYERIGSPNLAYQSQLNLTWTYSTYSCLYLRMDKYKLRNLRPINQWRPLQMIDCIGINVTEYFCLELLVSVFHGSLTEYQSWIGIC